MELDLPSCWVQGIKSLQSFFPLQKMKDVYKRVGQDPRPVLIFWSKDDEIVRAMFALLITDQHAYLVVMYNSYPASLFVRQKGTTVYEQLKPGRGGARRVCKAQHGFVVAQHGFVVQRDADSGIVRHHMLYEAHDIIIAGMLRFLKNSGLRGIGQRGGYVTSSTETTLITFCHSGVDPSAVMRPVTEEEKAVASTEQEAILLG